MEHLQIDRWLLASMQRRRFLVGAGFLTGTLIASQWPHRRLVAAPKFSDYPFKLGVASGEPLPDGVVLWTRLAPDPLNGGGMSSTNVAIRWSVALDSNMKQVVKQGRVLATPELAHSVRVEVRGLEPGRDYYYQFQAGGEISPVGRTRTAPGLGETISELNFTFASCQEYQSGFYTAYNKMAQENLDFVVHLGDYLYEGGITPLGVIEIERDGIPDSFEVVRQHNSPEVVTLEEYRNRHALYKTDLESSSSSRCLPLVRDLG